MDEPASFGYWVRRRRKALDLTQATLARRVGCAEVTIQKIEAEERRPSAQLAALLAEQLQIPADERAAFLAAGRGELIAGRGSFPPAATRPSSPAANTSSSPHNLPIQPTALLGREQEIAGVCALLRRADVRLVTLTGTGGTGKTRLALQVASELVDTFRDGAWFVNLAPLSEPNLVATTIAQTLGVRENDRTLHDSLLDYLREKQLLLVLDNFEQVVDAAWLVAELLAAAPGLKVLTTSRVALHLSGEHEFPVPPLALPNPRQGTHVMVIATNPAVALFVARAQAVQPAFMLAQANAAAVVESCRRLDGLPLAIELAAARVKVLSPQALLARLDQTLKLLTTGARDAPARQQTMRNTIEWSYNLLDAGEQRLFARLGVFVGGWTLEAADGVCNADHDLPFDVLDGLAALLDKSLLKQEEGTDGEPRFTMLETIREYALEWLDMSGVAETVRQQHAAYYLGLSKAEAPDDRTQRRLDTEYDNLWSAVAWSHTSAGNPEVALGLTDALMWLTDLNSSRRHEAIAALERALDQPLVSTRTTAHAWLRTKLAQVLMHTGNYAAAQRQFEQALTLAHELGDRRLSASILGLGLFGVLAREQGDSATAWSRMTESLAIFRDLGDMRGAAETLASMAEVAILEEDPARAEALLADSHVAGQRVESHPAMPGWMLNHLGHAAQLRGDYQRAMQLHQDSLELFQSLGDPIPWAYQSLGETALGLGQLDEARRWLAQGMDISRMQNDQACIAWCLAGLGSVAALDEEPERAARLWGAAEQLRQSIGCRPAPAARATYERTMTIARGQLGEEAFTAAWAEGLALTLEQAIAEALGAGD